MSADADLRAILPDAPPPRPAAREAALAAALARFDAGREGSEKTSQGNTAGARQRHRGGDAPPRAEGTGMRRSTYYKIAAGLALVALPGILGTANLMTSSAGLDAVQMNAASSFDAPSPPARDRSKTIGEAAQTMGPSPGLRLPDMRQAAENVRGMLSGGQREAAPGRDGGAARSRMAETGAASPAPSTQRPPLSPNAYVGEPQADMPVRPTPPMAAAPQAQSRSSAGISMAYPQGYPYPQPYQPEPRPPGQHEAPGRDAFAAQAQSPFRQVKADPVSTFSLDVDTASYGFARAALARNVLPPRDSVRTEEFLNYFPYAYPAPERGGDAFRASVTVMPSPWNAGRKLVHVGIKAYDVPAAERPKANLVFLIDTSGSMDAPNRLPLAKQALRMLLGELRAGDTVGIVAYAGAAGTVLEPTDASDRTRIEAAIDRLGAGGSTAGAEGIRQAYALAERNFDPKAVNRILLATDGDFNVGISSPTELKGFVERKRETGIYLSVLGFGMGNYHDTTMQALAQNGNGTASYIDGLGEARKVLVQEATSAVVPVADDAKAQVEFNPRTVAEYRLVGYEKRLLRREDFNNDRVDAGEIGSGHTVTALYEIVPVGATPTVTPLRYGDAPADPAPAAKPDDSGEYGFLQLRYKRPGAKESTLMTQPFGPVGEAPAFDRAPGEARFAIAAAGFAELLRGSPYVGGLTWDDVIAQGLGARGDDPFGYRSEFVQLVRTAKALSGRPAAGR